VIPSAFIDAWKNEAPWQDMAQVEQDLVLCRAIAAVFADPFLSERLAFRGGTALHKLYLLPPSRYSEDLDLVQRDAGPIGPVLDRLHLVLDPWLGKPRTKQKGINSTLVYSMSSEGPPVVPLRLKVEINTREHGAVHGFVTKRWKVSSRWFTGSAGVTTYTLDELLGTKLRALYQRRKGRDLFDMDLGLRHRDANPPRVAEAFKSYMQAEGHSVSRTELEKNLAEKMEDPDYGMDIRALTVAGEGYDVRAAGRRISKTLLVLL